MAEHAEHHDTRDSEHAHVHGQMDIAEHERTFEGFIRFWVLVFGVSIGILIFLALFNS